MLALLFVDLIVGFIVYQIAKKKENQKLMTVSMYILKLGFITLFLFNILNLSFSIGTHFKYANPSTTEHYMLGTIGAILGVCIYIFAAAYMQFVKEG